MGILVLAFVLGGAGLITAVSGVALFGTVFAAVYHAEVVAHRVGEPFGTLVLALAVTVIETALIVSVMIAAPNESAGLARDTVFAAVMIVCNGIVGACLLAGGAPPRAGISAPGSERRPRRAGRAHRPHLGLSQLCGKRLGPRYSTPQLVFAAIVSLVLYGSFVFVQTVRHRDYFLPVQIDDQEAHAPPPANKTAALSAGLLLVSLVAIVGLAKILTPAVEFGVAYWRAQSRRGIVIAASSCCPKDWPHQDRARQSIANG